MARPRLGCGKPLTEDRVKKILDAGVDQFGGESCPELVLQLVKEGKLTEARIDSASEDLTQKFELGLFDNPFVDESKVAQVLGKPASMAAGEGSQRRAMTLLKNDNKVLPLMARQAEDLCAEYRPKVGRAIWHRRRPTGTSRLSPSCG
jgi:beta-glucosidase